VAGPRRAYLVRHARAEGSHPQGDSARRLTGEGRAAFEALLADLAAELAVTRILASPFARARETAELLARATGAPVVAEEALASGRAGGHELLALAASAGAGAALVGHNPELAEAVSLAAGRAEEVPPGAIALVEWAPDGPRIAWVRKPAR